MARLRLLADRRVGTKITIAVAAVAVFGTADGLYGLASLSATNQQVKDGYGHEQELAAIGNLRAAANRVWLGMDDYLLAGTAAGRTTAEAAIGTAQQQVEQYASAYGKFPAGPATRAAIAAFRTHWSAFTTFLTGRLLPASAAGDTARVDSLRTGGLAGTMSAVRADLTSLSKLTVAAGAEQETTAENRYQRTKWWVSALLVAGLLAGLSLAAAVTRMIVRPLGRCVAALDRLATGDLTARVPVTGSDEVGRMSATLNTTATEMAAMVGRINTSSSMLAEASDELSAVSAQLSASAEETAAQIDSVHDAAGQVSQNVQTVSAGADEMGASIQEIANNANEAAGVAAQAARAAESTNTSVARLGEASTEIGTVVALITSIAEQTNLLALNATIEAARAGEAGKGFAVVASEVKDLAQETARATTQITTQVGAIQAESTAAITAIGQIGQVIGTINAYTTTIAAAVEEQTATTGEISRSVGQAADGSTAIAETIAGVAEATRQVTAGATETQQTATELARTAAELHATVARYRL